MAVKLTAVILVEILPRGRNQAQQGQNRHERLAGKSACLAFGVCVVSVSDGGAFVGGGVVLQSLSINQIFNGKIFLS